MESWRVSLSEILIPGLLNVTSKINDTFEGNGYFLKYITQNFENTLVLATEYKKIYCDELKQIIFPEVVDAIEKQMRERLKAHAIAFYNEFSR